jgi:DNA polymerase/3'-5' exonuclease PolX
MNKKTYSIENVWGIGPTLAKKLHNRGYKTRRSLIKIVNELPKSAQIDLKYNPIKRIPRRIIEEIEQLFKKKVKMTHTFAGSYRRKLPYSGDIDIVIIPPSNEFNLYEHLANKLPLHSAFSKGKSKISCLIKHKEKHYKIDFFIADKNNYLFMLFYATGSKIFNIRLRQRALKMGYTLNQTGLYKNNKLIKGLKTEKDIMNALDLEYKPPIERSMIPVED